MHSSANISSDMKPNDLPIAPHRRMAARGKAVVYAIRLMPMLVLVLPAIAQAQFTYATNNGTITITGYTGPGGAVTIPSTINALPVTAIGRNAFYQQYSLTSLTLPNSVTNVGEGAFNMCQGLTQVTLGNAVQTLGEAAFDSCNNLTQVTLPNSLLMIGDS